MRVRIRQCLWLKKFTQQKSIFLGGLNFYFEQAVRAVTRCVCFTPSCLSRWSVLEKKRTTSADLSVCYSDSVRTFSLCIISHTGSLCGLYCMWCHGHAVCHFILQVTKDVHVHTLDWCFLCLWVHKKCIFFYQTNLTCKKCLT